MIFQQPNLYLPPQGAPPGNSAPAAARTILAWLKNLPIDDPSAAGSRLFSNLVRLNGFIIEPAERFKALESMHATHSALRQALHEDYGNQLLPLSGDASRIASLVRRMDDAMATGYKLVIADMCGANRAGSLFRRKTMPLAVYRAMSHLGSSIADAYEVYVPPSPTLWHDLHELFSFAADNQLQARVLNSFASDADSSPASTIEGAYKAILLLALANPFRLHTHDVLQMLPLLTSWAKLCPFGAPDSDRLAPYPVGVKARHDRSPGYLQLDLENYRQEDWYLDTAPLAAQLQRLEGDAPVDPELLQRLITAWDIRAPRRFTRVAATARVEASLGLHQLHQLFKLSDQHNGAGNNADPDDRQATDAPTTSSGWTPKIDIWRLKDRSPGGYCLSLQTGQSTRTRVGELIGVRGYPTKSLAAGGWLVGVVRWLRSQPGSSLEAGVEWLAPRAEAVRVKPMADDGEHGDSVDGLVLPEVRVFNRDATLIMPTQIHSSSLRVKVASRQHQEISLGNREEDTGEHARFWICPDALKPKPVVEDGQGPATKPDSKDSPQE